MALPAVPLRSREEAEELFHANTGLAIRFINERRGYLNLYPVQMEDLEQLALWGLWIAANRYDKSMGAAFSTCAWFFMLQSTSNGLRRVYGRYSIRAIPASCIERHQSDSRREFNILDIRVAPTEEEPPELPDWLEPGLSAIRPAHRCILALRFGLDGREQMTVVEIANLLGVSRPRINQIIKGAQDFLIEFSRQFEKSHQAG